MEEYLKQHYKQLVGFTVHKVEIVKTREGLWPLLFLIDQNGQELEVGVDADPEGNGPGHLMIEHLIAPTA